MNAAMTNFIIGLEKQRFPSISPRVRRAKRARGQPARGGLGWGEQVVPARALRTHYEGEASSCCVSISI